MSTPDSHKPARPPADRIFLAVVIATVAVAVVRFGIAVVVLPEAQKQTVEIELAQDLAAEGEVVEIDPLSARGLLDSFWGGRRFPYRYGGDYLGVLSRNSTARSLGCAVGVLIERTNEDGPVIKRVIVPRDRSVLHGRLAGTSFTQADGEVFANEWASLKRDIRYFSDVTVNKFDYPSVLTSEQAAEVAEKTSLTEESKALFVGEAPEGDPGTWILLARDGERREYLLVPKSASPVGRDL